MSDSANTLKSLKGLSKDTYSDSKSKSSNPTKKLKAQWKLLRPFQPGTNFTKK